MNYIAITNWDYGNLALTEKSRDLLKGHSSFEMRKFTESSSTGRSKSVKREITSSHGRDELFEQLKDLRFSIATEKGVPAFVIFSDKSLHDMCHLMPTNREQFLLVNGVGVNKCENYSEDFLKVIEGFG